MSSDRPAVEVSVIMRKERIEGPMSRWQAWRWILDDVVRQESGLEGGPRLLQQTDVMQRWLHPGFRVALFKDDAEGYHLNVTTAAPCWFVLWRMEESAGMADEPMALPAAVSLSYHDAGRWLDAQETVEQVKAPSDIIDWVRAFALEHYVEEPKRRKRPASFQPLADRFGNPASVSTIKKFGDGDGHG
jgi:Protein of unknown function (DUF3305)